MPVFSLLDPRCRCVGAAVSNAWQRCNSPSTEPWRSTLGVAAYRAARLAEGKTVVGGIVMQDEQRRWMLNESNRYACSEEPAR
jgi:hypothetical protein